MNEAFHVVGFPLSMFPVECSRKNPSVYPKKTRYDSNRRNRALFYGAKGIFTQKEFVALCLIWDNKCLCCGRDDVLLVADHIMPLKKGGGNTISNIQPLCKSCNSKKHLKTIDYRHISSI